MLNKKFNKTISLLLVLTLLNLSSLAHAKKKPMRAFSFVAEGGKASQIECDGERELPRRFKKIKEFSKMNSYMGSELQSPEIKGKDGEEMWKHFFRVKAACNVALAKTPSAKASATDAVKSELPPDDADDDDQPESPEKE